MSSDDPLDLTDLSKRRNVTNAQIAVAITSLAIGMRHMRDAITATGPRLAAAESDIRTLKETALTSAEHRWVQDTKSTADAKNTTRERVREGRLIDRPAYIIGGASALSGV